MRQEVEFACNVAYKAFISKEEDSKKCCNFSSHLYNILVMHTSIAIRWTYL